MSGGLGDSIVLAVPMLLAVVALGCRWAWRVRRQAVPLLGHLAALGALLWAYSRPCSNLGYLTSCPMTPLPLSIAFTEEPILATELAAAQDAGWGIQMDLVKIVVGIALWGAVTLVTKLVLEPAGEEPSNG